MKERMRKVCAVLLCGSMAVSMCACAVTKPGKDEDSS